MNFLKHIIDLKHQSTALGWIKDPGIDQSLDAKMESAKQKLEAGDKETTKSILNAFLNEVEAHKGQHLTSEAHGLLKYNVRYLLKRL